MAEFTPQSLKRMAVADGIRVTVYSPYSSCVMSLASIMVSTAIIMVEAATPMNSWKLPVADFLPISMAFCMVLPLLGLVVFGCFLLL